MDLVVNLIQLVLAGGIIGFIIGLTGVGGGSLMTPFLLWYGIPPATAVGTDLLYAAITKSNGIAVHHRLGHIHWRAVGSLAATSLPAAFCTTWILSHWLATHGDYSQMIRNALGFMLLLTGIILLLKPFIISKKITQHKSPAVVDFSSRQLLILSLVGIPLGSLVALSSVGAGVIGTMLFMIMLPQLSARNVVGTDLAHAVPLTFVAGISHLMLLNAVDWGLLLSLIIGSLPCVYFGSKASRYVPDRIMQAILAIGLTLIGGYYLYDSFG